MEECPLCGTKFDETDKNFKPCTCSYQVCSFCFDKLINDKEIEPLCPACRVPYNLKKIKFTPPSNTKVVSKVVKKKKKKETPKKKEEISLKSRKELENYRVLQRNLVYITNIPLSLAKEEILRKHEYFGQYGNITKIVVNKGKYFNTTAPGGPSVSAYVTFDKKRMEDTYLCILAVDGCWLENRTLRASYGTTKYCSFFLKNITCTNNNCMYLHALGRKEDSFSKEEMNQGKHLTECGLKIDFNLVPKPTKASILPPPGVIAKELPKDKRKRGYFDPNEKKELNVKLPQKTDSTSPQEKPLEELSEKLESSSLNDKEEDDDSSEGEEEDGSEDDSDNQNQNSSEEKKEELSISEKIKNMKRQKNIKYGNDFNRYKKQPPGMQRRKPSGEVEDNPILSNPKPNRKHSDHHYDKPSERDTSYRRYSDIGHEKPKGSSKFEPTILRGKFSHVRPPPSYSKPNRGSDGSIFSLPSINESEDLNPPNNIWSEEFSRSRSVSNVIPPFTEMEQGHYVNPGFYYPPPMQYNMHYGQEPHKEDERNYGKHPNHPGNNHPNFNPNGHPVNHPNFQNPYFKQKMSANDVYWGGYPNYPIYPPGQYHPNMPYHPGFNYPNYPPNYYPPMYHQEPPQPNNNGPNTQNPPNQNNNGNNNNNKGSNDKNGGNGNNGGGNGNNGQSHNGHLFPSHLSGNNKHSSSTPNIHNMNVPLYYTQRGSQENFSEHLLNRNYQQQFQPNPPMYHYPLFPPPGHTFSYLPNPPSNNNGNNNGNGNGNGNGNQNSQSNPSFLGHNNHNVPSGYSTPHNSQHNTLSSILDTNEGSDNDVILKDPTYDSDSHRDNVTSHDVKDQNNSNVTQGNDDTNETSGDDEENINVDSNSSSTNTNKSHKKHK